MARKDQRISCEKPPPADLPPTRSPTRPPMTRGWSQSGWGAETWWEVPGGLPSGIFWPLPWEACVMVLLPLFC